MALKIMTLLIISIIHILRYLDQLRLCLVQIIEIPLSYRSSIAVSDVYILIDRIVAIMMVNCHNLTMALNLMKLLNFYTCSFGYAHYVQMRREGYAY